jgi:hypothetical protein
LLKYYSRGLAGTSIKMRCGILSREHSQFIGPIDIKSGIRGEIIP